jgi:hypothetical protein
MAVANGFGKVVTSGSVFMYDTGDTVNSYKGQPGYNVTGTPVAWVGNNNTSDFKTTTGTTTVNIPAIGTREVYYVDIWNTGASNCCPSLWRYGNWGIATGVTGNTLYTYSIIYKTNSGYTHPNFMYRYEFNGGSYITEVGVFDNAKRIDLGDGWYQAYNTFTTNASTNTLYLGMWYYQYNVYDTVYLYKASLTQGNHVFPPEQFIPPSTTRSDTQGLLPLVGNSTLNLSSVSFDSNAQMVFDGTDDRIDIGNFSVPYLTVSTWVYKTASTTNQGICRKENGWAVSQYNGTLQVAPGTSWTFYNTGYTIPLNTWVNIVYTYSGTGDSDSQNVYINGNKIFNNSNGSGPITSNSNPVSIGYDDNNWFWNGYISNTIIYNRALSAAEVTQNYNKYKTRFNLP